MELNDWETLFAGNVMVSIQGFLLGIHSGDKALIRLASASRVLVLPLYGENGLRVYLRLKEIVRLSDATAAYNALVEFTQAYDEGFARYQTLSDTSDSYETSSDDFSLADYET